MAFNSSAAMMGPVTDSVCCMVSAGAGIATWQ
jgi:hypothetical protein